MTKKWVEINSDKEFTELFTNAHILRATAYFDFANDTMPNKNRPDADVYWELSNGTWLAMYVSTAQGCETCGYGSGEKSYYKTVED